MDRAVALVQAYLNVNGHFTVVEYPVLESSRRGPGAIGDRSRCARGPLHWCRPRSDSGHGHRPNSGQVFEPDHLSGAPPIGPT